MISRGFLHPEDSEELFQEASERVVELLNEMAVEQEQDWDNVRTMLRDVVARFLRKRTGRRPVVVPVVLEV
jgi:ribonuclease J